MNFIITSGANKSKKVNENSKNEKLSAEVSVKISSLFVTDINEIN